MSWELSIPFRDEDELVVNVVAAARETLEGDELRLVEALVHKALSRGTTGAGEFFDELEQAGPDGRPQLVDEARKSIGMETIAEQQGREAFEVANEGLRNVPHREADGRTFQVCSAPNGSAYPLSEQGVPLAVADRRWWCDRHRDQAGPSDHLPPDDLPQIDYATMRLIPSRATQEREERELEAHLKLVHENDEARRRQAEEHRQAVQHRKHVRWNVS